MVISMRTIDKINQMLDEKGISGSTLNSKEENYHFTARFKCGIIRVQSVTVWARCCYAKSFILSH